MQDEQRRSGSGKAFLAKKKRSWWAGVSLLAVFLLVAMLLAAQWLSGAVQASRAQTSMPQDLASYVNPFSGTVSAPQNLNLGAGFNSGDVFPGAVVPRGMVQWSPDTTNAPGGYRYNQNMIHGFSLTHFSGRGCPAYQDFPFLPAVGPLPVSPFSFSTYAASFSHQQEAASPGYYRVFLPGEHVQVELTATLRTGFGRFTYPTSTTSLMLINAGGSATGDTQQGTGIQVVGNREVTGQATSGHFCGSSNTYTLYFVAQFDQPFTAEGTWQGTNVSTGSLQSSGSQSGAYLQFNTTRNHRVQVRIGLSFVSVANALMNLQQENPTWNFDRVRSQARAAWDSKLRLIQLQGGSLAERQTFYTALYHTFMHPNVFSDVNGQYIGFDDKIHVARGYVQYENFPGWDMYRSLLPLQTMLEPQTVGDMLQSLVEDAQQGGGGLPRWEVANDNSGGMVGDSMDVVMADAYALGVRNFDVTAALQAMEAGASDTDTRAGRYPTREGLAQYLSLGYVPTTLASSASITLEYAIDDYAIGQLANALGQQATAQKYLTRSLNWRNLFDKSTGYIVPRNPDGTYLSNFVPQSNKGFIESSSATYTWMVPEDLPGLLTKMGGNAVAVARLDQHFQKLNDGESSLYAFLGNEPEFGVPWIYDFAGRPDRTEDVIRQAQMQLFNPTPAGLPGNDDGGAMSSWYIFSALGFYPEIPGVGGFALGSPLFSAAQIHLGNGAVLTIVGKGAADNSPYVQSLRVNRQVWTDPWLPWSTIQTGGTLAFTLGSRPNLTWSTPIYVP